MRCRNRGRHVSGTRSGTTSGNISGRRELLRTGSDPRSIRIEHRRARNSEAEGSSDSSRRCDRAPPVDDARILAAVRPSPPAQDGVDADREPAAGEERRVDRVERGRSRCSRTRRRGPRPSPRGGPGRRDTPTPSGRRGRWRGARPRRRARAGGRARPARRRRCRRSAGPVPRAEARAVGCVLRSMLPGAGPSLGRPCRRRSMASSRQVPVQACQEEKMGRESSTCKYVKRSTTSARIRNGQPRLEKTSA